MKIAKLIGKIVVALAAIAGVVYVIATYGNQIVAWCKKVLASLPCCKEECCCDGECNCDCDCDECDCEGDCNDCDCAEGCCCEDAAEEVVEEVAEAIEEIVEEVAEEADFEN